MNHLDVILPFVFLAMTYLIKLAVDEKVRDANSICSLCELPIDMIFLAITFLIAVIISNDKIRNEGLLYTLVFIVFAIIVVLISKRSVSSFQAGNKWWVGLLALNLVITMLCLALSINILNSLKPDNNLTKSETQTDSKTSIK